MYEIKLQDRMSGEWTFLYTDEPLNTLDKAMAQYNKIAVYSSDHIDYKVVDETGKVIVSFLGKEK